MQGICDPPFFIQQSVVLLLQSTTCSGAVALYHLPRDDICNEWVPLARSASGLLDLSMTLMYSDSVAGEFLPHYFVCRLSCPSCVCFL